MIKEKILGIKELTKEEKLILAGELWDEVFEEGDVELTDDQKLELNRRIKYADEHPNEMLTWEKVREDIRKKYGS